MTARSKPPAAEDRLPMPSSEIKAHCRNRERTARIETSCIETTSAIEKESASQKNNKRQKASEQVVEGNSASRRTLRPRAENRILPTIPPTIPSTQKESTRKRSREAEAEKATDLRRSKQRKQATGQRSNRATASLPLAEPPKKRQRQGNSRKRAREDNPTEQSRKRHRSSFPSGETAYPKVVSDFANTSDITEWAERVAEETDTVQHQVLIDYEHLNNMHRLLAEKKTLQRKRSSSSVTSNSPSDQGYQDTRYATNLETNGSFMKAYPGEVSEEVKEFNENLCQTLLENEHPIPKQSLFDNNHFEATMDLIQDRNEAMINEIISELMFPNVQVLAIRDAKYEPFIQSVNEGWNNCKKITQTRPQPDSAVGFKVSSLSAKQLEKLQPWLGDLDAKSHFRATYYMLFPFITREVKRGNIGLDIADRQNAHSHTVALRGLAALFRLFGREQELHGKILTYSISHDHRTVRLYGHQAIIVGQNTTCWREEIEAFDFRTRKGRNRWKCRQFYLNALDEGLKLLEIIRTAIDDWKPDPALEPLQRSDTLSAKSSGLSQQFDDQSLSDDDPKIPQPLTPDSSAAPQPAKKKR